MTNTLNWVIETNGSGLGVAHLTGRLDIASAADAKRAFGEAIAEGNPRLIVDLAGVSFIDSSGLSTLVSGLRTARQAGGDLRIAAAGSQPAALFALTSLDQVFRLYPSVDEATRSYEE